VSPTGESLVLATKGLKTMSTSQREFNRLSWKVVFRLWKLDGQLRWMMESVQLGGGLRGDHVDGFYDRLFALHDAIDALKRSSTWRSVDVPDDETFDDA